MRDRPIVAMDLSTKGQGGGPFTSTSRIMNSTLKEEYDFRVIHYDPTMGRFISIKRILDLKKQIQEINPDLVHFTGLQLAGFHIAFACALCGVANTVVTIRGMSGDSVYFNPIKKYLLKYIIEPLTLLMVDRFYCVSRYVSERGIARVFSYKSKGYIYNYPPLASKTLNKNDVRREFGFDEDDFVVVSVGRINKEKGYHVFERVVARFSGNSRIKFLIAGDGDYLEAMKRSLSGQVGCGQVVFLGFREDVQKVNCAGDIFVLPTLHETLSVALLEASQAGLALIASDTGGVPEIVENGHNGFLVKAGDDVGLEERISYFLENPIEAIKLGSNAKEKVAIKFNPEIISNKIKRVYQELLSR